MVVAEIPLWVAHGGSYQPTDGVDVAAAENSLSLLLAKQTKTAIYSVDTNPVAPLFATAGGDGTIRLWNTAALFPKTKTSARFQAETGAYVSSSSGGDSSVDSGELLGDGDDDDPRKVAASSSIEGDSSLKDDTSLLFMGQETGVQIHDLVARRKDGTVIDVKAASAAAAPAHPSSPTRGRGDKKGRLVCTLTAHTGSSVLCVRFSTSGKLLASAGDDASVCVYGETTSLLHHHHQQWQRTKLCRGHGLDVVDLAWAPDDTHLVSCSLDSATPIIVWKLAGHNSMVCSPFQVLGKGIHTSTVKGVAFDPAGSYFASSGDDPAICIWRAHDDWGLEARIDDAAIFRQWKDEDSVTQSMFRRLSWATDGSFLCTTNAVVKNKHVASTISREGWTTGRTATNLVGHRQPVVVCRHSPRLLNNDRRKGDDNVGRDNNDDEPEYATLLALGDRRGFVTVWSTKKTRPLFKLQCSESRCTVTDLAWGMLPDKNMMLLVSLLDGQVVAIKFAVPTELGPLLSAHEQARVFELRYGINTNDDVFVGGNSGPRLIENALQMSLEEQQQVEEANDVVMDQDDATGPIAPRINTLVPRSSKNKGGDGKKRIELASSTPAIVEEGAKKARVELQGVQQPGVTSPSTTTNNTAVSGGGVQPQQTTTDGRTFATTTAVMETRIIHAPTMRDNLLPFNTGRIHSIDLPPLVERSQGLSMLSDSNEPIAVAHCVNGMKTPNGSKGGAVPSIDLVIKISSKVMWKDQLPGTSCTSLCATKYRLALGTADGAIQLYGTSPSKGWESGFAFRSNAPMVVGFAIVSLQLRECDGGEDMLVVAADGSFAVYSLVPQLSLQFKGTVFPAMRHMSVQGYSNDLIMPKLSRVQLTDFGSVFVILSHGEDASAVGTGSNGGAKHRGGVGVGGSLHAFLYDKASELWLRMADSRFALSDFFTTVPSTNQKSSFLARAEDSVKFGSVQSTLKSSRTRNGDRNASLIYDQLEDDSGSFIATRSHCEDRMACALALNSPEDFQEWLVCYARTISRRGMESQLRHLLDLLLGRVGSELIEHENCQLGWWLSYSPDILGLDRRGLVKNMLLPEIGKNRALQRIVADVSMQLQSL